MPYEVIFKDNLPTGYSLTAGKKGQNIEVQSTEFVSSEDGNIFISRLEGLPNSLLAMLPRTANVYPSNVDHLVAIIRPDRTGTIYVNELNQIIQVRPRRAVKAGEEVFAKDILDISRLNYDGVTFPSNAGVVILMSAGWRKGLFYDLSPISVNPHPRNYDLELTLGKFYSYLLFQELFKVSDSDWNTLFTQMWFPFIYLGQPLIKQMLAHIRSGWLIDDLLEVISEETKRLLVDSPDIWKLNKYAQNHIQLIEKAVERYLNDDYMSASSILFPRIEGLMRSYQSTTGIKHKPTGSNLTKAVVDINKGNRHDASYLLPEHFRRYLDAVYFMQFSGSDSQILSRHSLAHGVADASAFTKKSATIGFLILYQLALFMKQDSKK